MTPNEIKKLDRFFQQRVLENSNYKSVFGGLAQVAHHFFGRANKATRWYIPNGIPLTDSQHKRLETKDRVEMEMVIIDKLGDDWYQDLLVVSNRVAKYFTYQDVFDHIAGKRPHYIPDWYV